MFLVGSRQQQQQSARPAESAILTSTIRQHPTQIHACGRNANTQKHLLQTKDHSAASASGKQTHTYSAKQERKIIQQSNYVTTQLLAMIRINTFMASAIVFALIKRSHMCLVSAFMCTDKRIWAPFFVRKNHFFNYIYVVWISKRKRGETELGNGFRRLYMKTCLFNNVI